MDVARVLLCARLLVWQELLAQLHSMSSKLMWESAGWPLLSALVPMRQELLGQQGLRNSMPT